MLYIPFDDWWCCLNPRERNMVKSLTLAWFANSEYILQTDYTILAFVNGLAGLTKVNQYFVDHYGLTAGTIINEDDLPVPVFFFDAELWGSLYAFAMTANYLCDDPCKAYQFWT